MTLDQPGTSSSSARWRDRVRSGGVEPQRRLAITPGGVKAVRAGLRRRPLSFPLASPTWPGSVARPPVEKKLGTDYDSEWARRPPARVARAVLQEVVARPALRAVARPTVTGLDRIAHLDEPVIFAANHASHLDAPLTLSLIPDRWRAKMFVAGAADYFFDTRAKAAVFALLLNAVPIERQRVSRDSAQRVEELLLDGWSLLIFPEGGRSVDGWGQPHRGGAAWLAARTRRPVVPVHIEGTRQILPKGGKGIRPGRTHVSFGRPLRAGPAGPSGHRSETALARRLAADLEAAIASLADEQATDWWAARHRAASGKTPSLTGPDAAAWRRSWALGERDENGGRKKTVRWP